MADIYEGPELDPEFCTDCGADSVAEHDHDCRRRSTFQTPLHEGLASIHELYTQLRAAGFTMREAMAYIAELGKANQ